MRAVYAGSQPADEAARATESTGGSFAGASHYHSIVGHRPDCAGVTLSGSRPWPLPHRTGNPPAVSGGSLTPLDGVSLDRVWSSRDTPSRGVRLPPDTAGGLPVRCGSGHGREPESVTPAQSGRCPTIEW